MPNWCYTNITICHKERHKLEELVELLFLWTSKEYRHSDFGTSWLGNIVLGSKVGTVAENKSTDLTCRGSIIDFNLNDDGLNVTTETAWNPTMELWVKLLEKYLPDADIKFETEESGMGIYATNKLKQVGTYHVDSWTSEVESIWAASSEELVDILQTVLDSKENCIDKLLLLLHENALNDYICINKWKYASVYDFC